MIRPFYFSLIACVLLIGGMTASLQAQNSSHLKGTVYDEESLPLPYVNVYWLGTLTHTSTDTHGKFEIERTAKSNRLVVSSTGFLSDTIVVGSDPHLKITLRAIPMDEVQVLAANRGRSKSKLSIGNTERINMNELVRAACCSLGESFTTNPSVDVSTTDAASGTKQIKLLGLSGRYVQMQTENFPNFRGVSAPFALGYIPGSWIESIQISKGAASVKNGFESMTGQINVEYKKPNVDRYLDADLYIDQHLMADANVLGNWHLSDTWSTALLTHITHQSLAHDGNHDTFVDMPLMRQYNVMNRWTYKSDHTILQSGLLYLNEQRKAGQWGSHAPTNPYQIQIANQRAEGFAKIAHILDHDSGANMALILDASRQKMDASYGWRSLGIDQTNLYASLLYERQWGDHHGLSTGLSWQYDRWNREHQIVQSKDAHPLADNAHESVPGGYVQYTYNPIHELSIMGGIRADYSSLHGVFATPRMHIRYSPIPSISMRASLGKGYRTHGILTENSHLLASGRQIVIAPETDLMQESSWNYGLNFGWDIPVAEDKSIDFNIEYYYTDFDKRIIVDMDQNPHEVHFYAMQKGDRSFSHTLQVDASYALMRDLDLMLAFRYTDVRSTINRVLRTEPLTSLYKGMMSVSYKTPLRLWQADVTLSLNGTGRMPDPYTLPNGELSWQATFPAYPMLTAQVTRFFRNFSIYLGVENLTNYQQPNPIIEASNPWSSNFDSTMIWGPVEGMKAYIGVRFNLYDN